MSDDHNLNNNISSTVSDCLGTCKTPIGCTCKNIEEISADNAVLEFVEESPVLDKVINEPCCKRSKACCGGTHKLEVYDWLQDLPQGVDESQMVEVQFKNTRKGYFLNSNHLELCKGDTVAVEMVPGHDIGEVTLTGKLVLLQMRKSNYRGDIRRIYRLAKPNDIEKYNEAKSKEHKTMLRAREIAEELNLNMKISDVEYQGDGNKAIFYYIADERVDFRQLIKVYASEFRVKIEMKQIGARQEAGRVGGIGPCGRELCCSSSMSNFISVSTSAARLQDIPLNPQKLAGQCGKLKCCLNFEVDTYVEAQRKLPNRDIVLETKDASYYHFKTDILSGQMIYSTDKHYPVNTVTISKDRVYEIIRMNKRGEKPLHLETESEKQEKTEQNEYHDILSQGNINRFDENVEKVSKNNNKKKKFQKQRNTNDSGINNSIKVEGERRVITKANNIAGNNERIEVKNKLDTTTKTNYRGVDPNSTDHKQNTSNNNSLNGNKNNRHNRKNRHKSQNNAGKSGPRNPEA